MTNDRFVISLLVHTNSATKMKNEENILHETLQQVRELYTPANDIISKIQLKLAVGMLKSMIAAQGKVEKMGTALASRMQKYIKSKGR